jgi:hypothetical protein
MKSRAPPHAGIVARFYETFRRDRMLSKPEKSLIVAQFSNSPLSGHVANKWLGR